jgi:outer membrane protein assembly factor BamB
MIYAASANGVVAAHSAIDGDLVWNTNLGVQITGGAGIGSGLVFVASEDAKVIALDKNSGDISWSAPVSSEVLSAPNAKDDVVVLQTVDEKLIALSVEDGSQRWTYETTLPALTLRGSSAPVISSSGLVLAGFSNGTLVAVNASDGVWRWEERVAVPEGEYDIDRVIDIDGDLLVDGQRIFASSYQGNLMALDIETGRIVWGLEASSYHGLAQGFGNLYYVDDESQVFAIRDNTDEVVWENFDLKFRPLTAPLSINNYVAVADFEGYVHLLSQIDGRIVGREQIDSNGVRSNLLSANGLLYVYGDSGRLSAYRIE